LRVNGAETTSDGSAAPKASPLTLLLLPQRLFKRAENLPVCAYTRLCFTRLPQQYMKQKNKQREKQEGKERSKKEAEDTPETLLSQPSSLSKKRRESGAPLGSTPFLGFGPTLPATLRIFAFNCTLTFGFCFFLLTPSLTSISSAASAWVGMSRVVRVQRTKWEP
jgi:hypothetical protein